MSTQLIDPRQQLVIKYYKEPTSETFGNLKQSLIKAGYSPKYAERIYHRKPEYLTENIQATVQLVQQSESNLQKVIKRPIDLEKDTRHNIKMLEMQLEASKFILKTLAKQKYAEEKEKEAQGNTVINITKYGDRVIEAEVVNDDKSIVI